MSQEISTCSRLYYGVCCFVLFFVASLTSFNGYYEKWHFCEIGVSGQYYRATFESMVDGTAWQPYVYRQMLPSVADWLDRSVPRSVEDWLFTRQGSGHTGYSISAIADSPTARNKIYFFRYLVIYIVTFLFALLAVVGMYLVCRELEMPSPVAVFAPVIVILQVPYIMSLGGYFYDYPELAFIALAFWVALKFDWWWVIPIAALATWNKESFVLVIPTLYPIFRQRTSRFGALLGVSVLCLICTAVYFIIRMRFAHNPGSTVELRLADQLQFFLNPRRVFFATEETYGVRMLRVFSVIPMTLLVWTVWRGWKQLPSAIKRHGQIAAAINIPLYLLFCGPGELRDLSLLYIVFLAIMAVNLKDWIEDSGVARVVQTG
jgi:hypothetical protein